MRKIVRQKNKERAAKRLHKLQKEQARDLRRAQRAQASE
ncbi:possible MarR-family transcription repressor [Mycoplasmopsis bovigenitalium]|uniref:Possible MarR-family transcription repressor n=1 Tax=Mycoplasmopsis bovigenitalium TaxID=2112 RepID=A0A449AA12_9BACT|nr:possible MarR-family transcription repressor [Mycoplasmopsis bovigenitalium]